jgi:hypothetical protein
MNHELLLYSYYPEAIRRTSSPHEARLAEAAATKPSRRARPKKSTRVSGAVGWPSARVHVRRHA